jgi:hypothetical protein
MKVWALLTLAGALTAVPAATGSAFTAAKGASATGIAGRPAARTITLPLPVRELAADGRGAAMLLGKRTACHVVLWNARARRPTTIQRHCFGSNRDSAFAVARATDRVAWVETAGGNLFEEYLEVATAEHRKPRAISFAGSGPDVDGDYFGQVRGAGRFVFFTRFHRCVPAEPDEPPSSCPSSGAIDQAEVWVYDPATRASACPDSEGPAMHCRLLERNSGPRFKLAAASSPGLAVVKLPTGIDLFKGGKRIGALVTGPDPRDVALTSTRLLVRRGTTLDIYGFGGALERSLQVPAAKLVDAASGRALLVSGRTLLLVRLDDGRITRLRAPGRGAIHAQLESPGLFYSYGRHVRFLPLASTRSGFRTRSLVLRPSSSVALKGYGRLVADGSRAAAVGGCGILLWKAGARKGTFVQPCRGSRKVDSWGLDEVALAGDRLGWMREESISHGMRIQTELMVKTGPSKPREIASAYDDSGFGGLLISLAGGGDTLAFAWTYSFDEDSEDHVYRLSRAEDAGPCPAEPDALLPNPPQTSYCEDTGLPGGLVRGASGGRILVSFGGFSLISVVQPDNSVLDLPVPESQKHLELGISGSDVVVVKAGGSTLDVYDAVAGALRHRWPIARLSSVRHLTVGGGFAVFNAKGTHLVRLSDGSERTVLAPGKKPPVAAAMSSAGLFLLYRVKRGERLGFVPVSRLKAA